MDKRNVHIGIGVILGIIVSFVIVMVFVDQYDLLRTICISAVLTPVLAIVFGVIGAFWKREPPES